MRKYESHKTSISEIGDIVATYLDETGLAEVWSKVQSLVSSSGGGVTTLYDNSSGTNGSATLSQSARNFKFLVALCAHSGAYSVISLAPQATTYYVRDINAASRIKVQNQTVSIIDKDVWMYRVFGV